MTKGTSIMVKPDHHGDGTGQMGQRGLDVLDRYGLDHLGIPSFGVAPLEWRDDLQVVADRAGDQLDRAAQRDTRRTRMTRALTDVYASPDLTIACWTDRGARSPNAGGRVTVPFAERSEGQPDVVQFEERLAVGGPVRGLSLLSVGGDDLADRQLGCQGGHVVGRGHGRRCGRSQVLYRRLPTCK